MIKVRETIHLNILRVLLLTDKWKYIWGIFKTSKNKQINNKKKLNKFKKYFSNIMWRHNENSCCAIRHINAKIYIHTYIQINKEIFLQILTYKVKKERKTIFERKKNRKNLKISKDNLWELFIKKRELNV